jgi:hypothetical protein
MKFFVQRARVIFDRFLRRFFVSVKTICSAGKNVQTWKTYRTAQARLRSHGEHLSGAFINTMTLPERQRLLKNYLEGLAREYCHSLGMHYLSWERTAMAGSAGKTIYNAIASDGERTVTMPFTATMQTKMVAFERWMRTGVGRQPRLPGDGKMAPVVPFEGGLSKPVKSPSRR